MKQYVLWGLIVFSVLTMSGCFQKRVPPVDTSSDSNEVQDAGTSDTIDPNAGGSQDVVDMSDPEVEEIINLLEELVAEEDDEPDTDGVTPTTGS